jgi:hypothetical protein
VTDATDAARLLAALVDTLIPGAPGWPPAVTVGVQSALASRLIEQRGDDALGPLLTALEPHAEALLSDDEDRRVAAVAAWEAADKDLFGWVRDATYLAYYESPVVVLAINAHGHLYKARPHFTGYRLPRWDAARDTPTHGRGAWTPTDAVRRVDTGALDLADERTQNWGRKQ